MPAGAYRARWCPDADRQCGLTGSWNPPCLAAARSGDPLWRGPDELLCRALLGVLLKGYGFVVKGITCANAIDCRGTFILGGCTNLVSEPFLRAMCRIIG